MNPDIYYYNPTCEIAVANGSENFQTSALLRKFEYDLDIIPAFLGQTEDITLIHKMPSIQFLEDLAKAGIDISQLRLMDVSLKDVSFANMPKGFLFPWGWSPAVHKLLSPFKLSCEADFINSPISHWMPIHRELYSRKQDVELLRSVITKSGNEWLPKFEEIPEICTSHEEIVALQKRWGKIVVKSPLSSSGRGLQILRPNEYNQTNRQVISGFLNQQGYVIAGPWHNKMLDLSFQFFSYGKGRIDYKGLSSFITDKSGRYIGSYIEEIPMKINREVKEFIDNHLITIKKELIQALSDSPYSTEYYGWIGVDSIIYESEKGKLKFHPCIEVNCRYTMGALALALRDHLAKGSTGIFRIIHGRDQRFLRFCEEMEAKEPILIRNGKIVRGFIPLTPPLADSLFGAYLNIIDH